MIRVIINGILGRMGRELCTEIIKNERLFLAGGIDTLETFHNEEIFVSTDCLTSVEESDVA